ARSMPRSAPNRTRRHSPAIGRILCRPATAVCYPKVTGETPPNAPVHSPAMPTSAQTGPWPRSGQRSLTVVLPPYNEAQRLGPALDELFGYLDAPPLEGVHPR